MTDFFAQLAARHRAEAGVLRPHVPFRFEPVSASLAAADLTGDATAGSGWPGARPEWPLRRPGGPGLHEESWTGEPRRGPAAGDDGRQMASDDGREAAGPGLEPMMAGEPASGGLRPVHPDKPLRDQVADTERGEPGAERADDAAPGRTWEAGQGTAAVGAAPAPATPAPWRPESAASRQAVARQAVLRPMIGRPGQAGAGEAGAAESALDPVALDPAALDPAALDPVALDLGGLDPAAGPEPGAEPVARREWRRSGPGGDPDEADTGASADVVRSRRSPAVLSSTPPGSLGRDLPVTAPALARRRAWMAGDHAAGGPSGRGKESITVQVTIGRVEVRAAPPAARTAAERPANAPAAGPSLADYLRHRSRSAGARP